MINISNLPKYKTKPYLYTTGVNIHYYLSGKRFCGILKVRAHRTQDSRTLGFKGPRIKKTGSSKGGRCAELHVLTMEYIHNFYSLHMITNVQAHKTHDSRTLDSKVPGQIGKVPGRVKDVQRSLFFKC